MTDVLDEAGRDPAFLPAGEEARVTEDDDFPGAFQETEEGAEYSGDGEEAEPFASEPDFESLAPDPERRQWVEFFKAHREMDAERLPDEMLRQVAAGASPNEAYLAFRVKEYEEREALEAMRRKSVGSLAAEAGNGGYDPFEEAFDRVMREF